MPHRETPQIDSRAGRRHSWWGCVGALGVVALLFVSAALYWHYVTLLPPDRLAHQSPAGVQVSEELKAASLLLDASWELARRDANRFMTMTDAFPPKPASPAFVVATPRGRALLQRLRVSFRAIEQATTLGDDAAIRRGVVEFASLAFVAESQRQSSRGETGEALRSALDAVELGCVACKGDGVKDRYASQSCQMAGLEEIERLYPRLSQEGLATQLVRLRRLRKKWPLLEKTLEEEREIQWSACRKHLYGLRGKTPLERYALVSDKDGVLFTLGSVEVSNYFDFAAWGQVLTPHRAVLASIDRYYDELIANSGRPVPHGVAIPYVSSPIAAPFCDSSFTGQYRGEWARHNLAITETALAVRLFRLERGRFPQRLAEIPKAWLPEIPLDVWDHPIAYRLKNGKPLVYSLGADGEDEGGKAVNPSTHIRGRGGDLVFSRLLDSDWRKSP